MLLVIEPWAEEYRISPGVTVEIVDESEIASQDDLLEVEMIKGGLVVWGWAGRVLSVFHHGEKLEPAWQT